MCIAEGGGAARETKNIILAKIIFFDSNINRTLGRDEDGEEISNFVQYNNKLSNKCTVLFITKGIY